MYTHKEDILFKNCASNFMNLWNVLIWKFFAVIMADWKLTSVWCQEPWLIMSLYYRRPLGLTCVFMANQHEPRPFAPNREQFVTCASFWWLIGRLQYLQCISTGDTAVFHRAISFQVWQIFPWNLTGLGCSRQSLWELFGFCQTEPEFGLIFLILNMII